MRNAVQLCLAANNILLMRKWNHNFLLLAIALAWKWQIASLLKIFIYKQTRWSNDKTIIIKRMIQDFTLDPSRPRSPSAPGGPTGPWHINIQETSRQKIIETPVWIFKPCYHLKIFYNANKPLPRSKNPYFQNEARCTIFLVKMSFICMRMKNDFHIKGWAPTLVLKQRPGGTRKWPFKVGGKRVERTFWSVCNKRGIFKRREGWNMFEISDFKIAGLV